MDIRAVKSPIDFGHVANLVQKDLATQSIDKISTEDDVTDKSLAAPTDVIVHKKPDDSQEEVTQKTEALNKFFQTMDTHIRFKIHEKSEQLMVQVVDQANSKVLKEFPSSEFLDTVAAIRDYVGILLDEKI